MDIDIQLTRGRIPEPLPIPATVAGTAGAWVEFRGLVRGEEEGLPIAAPALYDMRKAVDRTRRIEGLRVVEKGKR